MNNLKGAFTISTRNLKIFTLSMVLVFLMVSVQRIYGVNHNKIVSPKISSQTNIQQLIVPKLESKPSSFKLKSSGTLVKTTKAASDYDQASSYVVIDLDSGEILEEKNLNKRLPIASLTKIMTAVVSSDLASYNEQFIVSDKASKEIPTKLDIPAGQKMTLEELLNGLLLVSANDSAETIKEGIDQKYGEEVFINAMNKKASFLSLKNSFFVNPQGFDEVQQYSSAGDLAILSHYALTYPLIAEIVKKDYQFYPSSGNHRQIDMYNWNGLLGVYPGAFGIKIGNTDDAGYTTIVASERGGKKLLVVLLGAPTVTHRDLWAAELLDLGFSKSLGLAPVNITEDRLKEKYASWKYFN